MKKIGILIPATSRKTKWKKIQDSYLYKFFIPSFNETLCSNHKYIIYLGIDKGDKIYDNEENQKILKSMTNIEIKFIILGIKKWLLTAMWNKLFKQAFEEECDYFYQCGDDIKFLTPGWVSKSIGVLQDNNNIGITGPININGKRSILTQTFVSRKHMDIFGYYFTEKIHNIFCDDWINIVYGKYVYKLKTFKIINASVKDVGERYHSYRKMPRNEIYKEGKIIFKKYLKKIN